MSPSNHHDHTIIVKPSIPSDFFYPDEGTGEVFYSPAIPDFNTPHANWNPRPKFAPIAHANPYLEFGTDSDGEPSSSSSSEVDSDIEASGEADFKVDTTIDTSPVAHEHHTELIEPLLGSDFMLVIEDNALVLPTWQLATVLATTSDPTVNIGPFAVPHAQDTQDAMQQCISNILAHGPSDKRDISIGVTMPLDTFFSSFVEPLHPSLIDSLSSGDGIFSFSTFTLVLRGMARWSMESVMEVDLKMVKARLRRFFGEDCSVEYVVRVC